MTQEPFDIECLTRRGVPRRKLDAGERVFLESDPGSCMYVVCSGAVEVISFGHVLDSVGPGGMLGDLALIDGGPRSAAALATEPTEVAVIDQATFDALVREEPSFVFALLRLMAERIRRMAEAGASSS